jgi:magnesium chelatase subunit I
MESANYPFTAIVGHETLKMALLLAAIDPRIGGVLIEGPRGTAKSTLARALAELLPLGRFVTLPLGATEERITGSLNLQKVLSESKVEFSAGLLQAADQGVLYVDEVNLLPDHLVDLLLDASASGVNVVERDGVSHRHPARFVLIGTMNPDEGELRPQLLDRFGFAVSLANDFSREQRIQIVKHRLAFDTDPEAFCRSFDAGQQALKEGCRLGRQRLASVAVSDACHDRIAELCHQAQVDGVRADLVIWRAARAHAAWSGRDAVTDEDIVAVAELALAHRRKETPPPQSRRDMAIGSVEAPERSGGDWGDLPPRPVPLGAAREVASLVKKKT